LEKHKPGEEELEGGRDIVGCSWQAHHRKKDSGARHTVLTAGLDGHSCRVKIKVVRKPSGIN
jgi:hypothetical protein